MSQHEIPSPLLRLFHRVPRNINTCVTNNTLPDRSLTRCEDPAIQLIIDMLQRGQVVGVRDDEEDPTLIRLRLDPQRVNLDPDPDNSLIEHICIRFQYEYALASLIMAQQKKLVK